MIFNIETSVIIVFIFLFAAFIHGSIGFGFPMVATPLLALFTDIQTAIILTLIPSVLINLISISSEGKILRAIQRYYIIAMLAMLGSAIGTQILIYLDSEIFKGLLGVAIIAYLITEKFRINLSWVRFYPKFSMYLFGILAGILGGLTNVMAPVLIIYSLESKHSKNEIVQISNLCFLFGKIVQFILFYINGKITFSLFSISSLSVIIASIALFIGISIKKKIKLVIYRKILRVLLLILASTLFIQLLATWINH